MFAQFARTQPTPKLSVDKSTASDGKQPPCEAMQMSARTQLIVNFCLAQRPKCIPLERTNERANECTGVKRRPAGPRCTRIIHFGELKFCNDNNNESHCCALAGAPSWPCVGSICPRPKLSTERATSGSLACRRTTGPIGALGRRMINRPRERAGHANCVQNLRSGRFVGQPSGRAYLSSNSSNSLQSLGVSLLLRRPVACGSLSGRASRSAAAAGGEQSNGLGRAASQISCLGSRGEAREKLFGCAQGVWLGRPPARLIIHTSK